MFSRAPEFSEWQLVVTAAPAPALLECNQQMRLQRTQHNTFSSVSFKKDSYAWLWKIFNPFQCQTFHRPQDVAPLCWQSLVSRFALLPLSPVFPLLCSLRPRHRPRPQTSHSRVRVTPQSPSLLSSPLHNASQHIPQLRITPRMSFSKT